MANKSVLFYLSFLQSIAPIVEYLYDTELNSSVPDDLYRVINQLYNQVETKLLFTKPAGDLLFGFQDDLYDLLVGIIENAIAGADLPDRFGLFSTVSNMIYARFWIWLSVTSMSCISSETFQTEFFSDDFRLRLSEAGAQTKDRHRRVSSEKFLMKSMTLALLNFNSGPP